MVVIQLSFLQAPTRALIPLYRRSHKAPYCHSTTMTGFICSSAWPHTVTKQLHLQAFTVSLLLTSCAVTDRPSL